MNVPLLGNVANIDFHFIFAMTFNTAVIILGLSYLIIAISLICFISFCLSLFISTLTCPVP